MGTPTLNLSLELIHFEADSYPRAEASEERIDQFTELLQDDAGSLPPIVVMPYPQQQGHYLGLDGFHRLAAHARAGLGIITAELMPPTTPALWEATSRTIGPKNLTREERIELVGRLIAAYPEKSDREIAGVLTLSPTTVGTYRRQLSNLDTKKNQSGAAEEPPAHAAAAATQEEYDPVWSILDSMRDAEEIDGKRWGLGADVRANSLKKALAEFEDPKETAKIALRWCRAGEKAAASVLEADQK